MGFQMRCYKEEIELKIWSGKTVKMHQNASECIAFMI
jgi:hypothetical protein